MIIYAIDDEPVLLRKLNNSIAKAVPGAELYSFSRATLLLDAMSNSTPFPDVAFLDIKLPGIDGIELAKRIKMKSPRTWIIFVTGFSEYALEAYEIHAFGYIMKPVTAERIRAELDAVRFISPLLADSALIRAKCFGTFEIFACGHLVNFKRSKTKELLAYLIDRNGAAVNTRTLCAVLWEDQPDSEAKRNYFRKLISDLSKTLAEVGAEAVFVKSRNSFAVDVTKIDCDYYRFLDRDPSAINMYRGEYMVQYTWSELTLGTM